MYKQSELDLKPGSGKAGKEKWEKKLGKRVGSREGIHTVLKNRKYENGDKGREWILKNGREGVINNKSKYLKTGERGRWILKYRAEGMDTVLKTQGDLYLVFKIILFYHYHFIIPRERKQLRHTVVDFLTRLSECS